MSWTEEEEKAFAKEMQNLAGRDEIDLEQEFMMWARSAAPGLLTKAAELLAARGGTLSVEGLRAALQRVAVTAPGEADALFAHLVVLGGRLRRIKEAATRASAELRHTYRPETRDWELVARAIRVLEDATTPNPGGEP